MGFNEIVRDIRSVKIQGAQNVAIASLKAYKYKPLRSSVKKLLSLRATEPCLENAFKFIGNDYKKVDKAIKHLTDSEKKIAEFGANKIKRGNIIFTHCHSSSVMNILIKSKGKIKEVHNTEARPLFQGRRTVHDMIKNNIKVVHYVDSGARLALKKADIMIIGADAILFDGSVINKIGTGMFAQIAKDYGIPVYVAADSWKFDSGSILGKDVSIEERPTEEIWNRRSINLTIKNYAFEKVERDLITGIISELGIYAPESFVLQVKKAYKWI